MLTSVWPSFRSFFGGRKIRSNWGGKAHGTAGYGSAEEGLSNRGAEALPPLTVAAVRASLGQRNHRSIWKGKDFLQLLLMSWPLWSPVWPPSWAILGVTNSLLSWATGQRKVAALLEPRGRDHLEEVRTRPACLAGPAMEEMCEAQQDSWDKRKEKYPGFSLLPPSSPLPGPQSNQKPADTKSWDILPEESDPITFWLKPEQNKSHIRLWGQITQQ